MKYNVISKVLHMSGTEFEDYIKTTIENGEELEYGTVVLVSFSPAEAKSFIELHFLKNRVLSPSNVHNYTCHMEANKFERNIGQTIIIDSMGHILDGHHRLESLSRVKNKNYTYDFIVVCGANTSPFLDTGKHRSFVDAAAMAKQTTQQDMEILSSKGVGKALRVYSSMNAHSGMEKTSYIVNVLPSIRDVCENFIFFCNKPY